jgi:NTE family protein
MTTAFVLSGGGSLGAVQVGMLQALSERRIVPDILVGTSAGAINATYVAGHGTGRSALQELAEAWVRMRRGDVFHVDVGRQLLAVAGWREAMFSEAGLRRLIQKHLPYTRLERAAIPVHVVTTDFLSGEEVLLSTGDAVSAVLASTSIPGLLPPVRRGGRVLVDGGLANNTAISQAVTLGAERVFVLPTGVACALASAPARPLASAVQALSFLTQQRLIHDVAAFASRAELHVLPPLCPLGVSPADFSRAGELIARARQATGEWLDGGRDHQRSPERFLSLHHHAPGPPVPSKGAL